ncbi:MAG: DegV family EDD domain-containing protein [Lachnospiraceae bacterium]|nr:DegV family EDD domain-containing protein [Lachnospiraceae bacterium]
MRKLSKYFYDLDSPFELKIFQVAAFGGMMAAFAGSFTSMFSNLPFIVVLVTLLGGVAACALMFIAKKTKKVELCSCILIFLLNCVILPLAFFTSGGVKSGISAWFVLGLFIVFLLIRGKMFWTMLLISLSSVLFCYVYSYHHPRAVVPLKDEWTSYEDIIFSILIVTLIIGLIVRFQNKVYEAEQQRVVEQNHELERLSRTRNNFFANMSHEIRTPINTIIGLNEMILREDISEEIAENAIHIQDASKMLLALINDILDMSKIESGKMEIVPIQYETGAMFSELVNLIWIRAHEKKLEFKLDISPEIPSMLYGDEVRIKQVVINLLSNAVKYTQKGFISLSARSEMKDNNKILLTISIRDSGIGIRKEDMDRLFQSFQRVDEGTNAGIEGTGLGLSISHQLVEMMGGKITVDSIYQKGSVFTIQIEQDIVNENPMGHMDFMTRGSTHKRKKYKQIFEAPDAHVLVVDDNEMNLLVAKKLLRETKIQVDLAKSGKECLELTKQHFYNVIFMDHMMPEMDGVETLNRVRQQENGLCREVPVIALTANVTAGAEQIYQEKGFQNYLAKPISSSLLEAVLLKYLPKELVEYNAVETQEETELIQNITGAKRKKIQITTDCVCDLPKEFLDHYDIRTMYCYVHTDKGRFCDINEITSDNLLEYLATDEGKAKSQTASVEEFETFFSNALGVGEKVIHVTTAQKVGNGYKVAMAAAQGFDNVIVVDSGHLSSGLGLMVMRAAHLVSRGLTVDEIVKDLEVMKNKIATSFIVPSAESLYRNGKISNNVKRICEVFNLHPVIYLKKSKFSFAGVKCGSMKTAYTDYIRQNFKGKKNIDTRLLFITYAGCSSKQLKEFKEEVLKYQKFERIEFQKASATISSNCGLGAMGVLYIKKGKDE